MMWGVEDLVAAVAGPSTAAPLRYDDAPARRRYVVTRLRDRGFLSIADLARELGVSDMTVRRDLRRLQGRGEVRMVHGGATLLHGTLQTPGFIARAGAQSEPKRELAACALTLLRNDDTVAIDSGTTAFQLASALPETFTGTVVTHSVPVLSLLLHHPAVHVIGLGGQLHTPSQAFVGPLMVAGAQQLKVRVAFIGAAAVDEGGVYVDADIERSTKLALMDIAQVTVLIADSSKFTEPAPVRLCTLDRVHTLVTDRALPRRMRERMRDSSVDVLVP